MFFFCSVPPDVDTDQFGLYKRILSLHRFLKPEIQRLTKCEGVAILHVSYLFFFSLQYLTLLFFPLDEAIGFKTEPVHQSEPPRWIRRRSIQHTQRAVSCGVVWCGVSECMSECMIDNG